MELKNILFNREFKDRKKGSLVNRFATIIGTSIFIALLFITAYNLSTSIPIFKQYGTEKRAQCEAVTNMVFQNFKKDMGIGISPSSHNQNNNFTNIKRISENLISNNLAMYINVIDKKSNKYIWSSIHGLEGLSTTDDLFSHPVFAERYKGLKHDDIREYYKEVNNHYVVVGFLDNDVVITLINVLLKGDIILVLIFIVFGFASAYSLARFITKPINDLVLGAEEFSKGNLKYRAQSITQDEIGILAEAFNAMAEKLDILYSSLEQQVKDRTNELVTKNTELEDAYKDLKEAQSMLVHSEKMKSLGQLVAGVAHELNNPINFIYGNLDHLKNYTNDLIKIITEYEKIAEKLSPEEISNVQDIREDVDYAFILSDLPDLIKSCKDGAERCKQIVLDLKNFSRIDEAVIKEVNIHDGIESTLNILHNKFKHRIDIHKEFANLPPLSCYAGQLNQVFMNILDNAAQAIPEKGDIYIKTDLKDNNIVVTIQDNGKGIPKDVLSRIFDPFFTTKQVGEGTGLGLSISYKIIKTHHGTIDVESEENKGTKFTIKIPLDWNQKADIVEV